MGLETASYLNDLVAANPDGAADQVSQGDNHIRLLKAVLQATFPSMAGAAWRVQTKTANYTLLATDNMSVINCTTALTLALTDVATVGNKFMALVSANGVAVTIDPSGAETVNGAATLAIPAGKACLLVCTGAAWLAYGLTEATGNLPLTGGTLSGILTLSTSGTPLVVNSTNSTIDKISLKDNGAQTGRLSSSAAYPLLVGNAAGTNWSFYGDQSGNFTALANVTAYSDERLKKNWAGLPNDFIERLAKVKHGTYDRTDIEQRQIGVSAQSLQALMPEAVMIDEADMLMVAYGNAALTACIALSEEVVRLRARLDTLEKA